MPSRLLVACLLGLVACTLLGGSEAWAGTYQVRQCNNPAPQNHFHEAFGEALPSPGAYAVSAGGATCRAAENEFALRINPFSSALHGQYGRISFVAPEGTSFRKVRVEAKLRHEQGHISRLAMADAAGRNKIHFGSGSVGPADFSNYLWPASGGLGPKRDQFIASLECINPDAGCPHGNGGAQAKTVVRNVRMTLEDEVAPTVALSGGLVEGGWISGVEGVRARFDDEGGGLRITAATVNGELSFGFEPLPCLLIKGTSEAASLTPCRSSLTTIQDLDTTAEPFREGANEILVCARDFGQDSNNECESRTLHVDNGQPELLFATEQLVNDPEVIRASASDDVSGLSTSTAGIEYRRVGSEDWLDLPTALRDGELRARAPSEASPPGEYDFRASVRDVAGNVATTTEREDGTPMRLRFPLKEDVRLRAQLANGGDDQLVGYRRKSRVEGRLLSQTGRPIAGQRVRVTETFDDGSLIERRVRRVRTDHRGRYRSALPGGPSRDIAVTYPGSRRYLGEEEAGLDLRVRGKARLRLSRRRVRAGKSVNFKGRVKRYFARIPPGGKLVEVQVKSGNSWTTLEQARGTNRKGRIKLRHRFRGFYTEPVTFTFRLKVTRENGWPYHGAATSQKRRLTVRPKRSKR